MRALRIGLHLALLVGCGVLSAASISWGDEDWDDWEEPEPVIIDDTWVVQNLFDGQTGVAANIVVRLTVGERDFAAGADWAVGDVVLYRQDDGALVPIDYEVSAETSRVWAVDGLEPDTDYVLNVASLGSVVTTIRTMPGPIYFSTRSSPQVTGLWRNDETLIVTFSEPMAADTLFVGQTSVDMIWEEDGVLRTIASDHNLSAYAWEPSALYFMLAPIGFADSLPGVWLKVAADIQGASGVSLDGDADGIGGQAHDDYLTEVYTWDLPVCFTRSDIPAPCVHENDVPNNVGNWW